jgi:predicted RNA-binding protein with PUA-like domain
MKSEPSEFSIDNLKKKKKHHWDGVRNYQARNFMRDHMHNGDLVIFYHSSTEIIGPAGIAKVVSLPYPDHTQFDTHSKYFDPKATKQKPIWYMVDVGFVQRFKEVLPHEMLKGIPALKDMILWKRNRLSITPLTNEEFEIITKLGV